MSNVFFVFRKIQNRLGGKDVLHFYQSVLNRTYNFCYVNSVKSYIINKVNYLLSGKKTVMFANNEHFVIHKSDQFCGPQHKNDSDTLKTDLSLFLQSTYPKQKLLPLVGDILIKHKLINKDLIFMEFPSLHVADLISCINNRFGKKSSLDPKLLKLCKYIHNQKIKFPKICIKNPSIQPFLC